MSPSNSRIDVVALLKIDVFEQVAADGASRYGIPVHLNALYLRNGAFHRHQSLAQIFVKTWCRMGFVHNRKLYNTALFVRPDPNARRMETQRPLSPPESGSAS